MKLIARYAKPGTDQAGLQVIERTNDFALHNTFGAVIAIFPRSALNDAFARKRAFIAADALFLTDHPGAPLETYRQLFTEDV